MLLPRNIFLAGEAATGLMNPTQAPPLETWHSCWGKPCRPDTSGNSTRIMCKEAGQILMLLLSHFSRVWLCNPIDGSPPGSPIPGILQARTQEWVAISFSNAWKWKVKVKSLSRVRLSATPWTAAYQAPLSMGVARQEYWSGLPLPTPDSHATRPQTRQTAAIPPIH